MKRTIKTLFMMVSLCGATVTTLPVEARHLLLLQATTTQQSETESDEVLSKLTAEEQARLTRPNQSPNNRVKDYVKTAAARLQLARQLLDQGKSAEVAEQLNIYAALIGHAGSYLRNSVKPRDKAHKTMEQGLRAQFRQLEGLRRDSFASVADVADQAMKTAEKVRLQSLRLALGAGDFLKIPRN